MWLTSRIRPPALHTSTVLVCGLAGCVVLAGCGPSKPARPTANTEQANTEQADTKQQSNGSSPHERSADSESTAGSAPDAEQIKSVFDAQWQSVHDGDSERLQFEDGPLPPGSVDRLVELDGKLLDLLIDVGGVSDNDLEAIAHIGSLEHLRIRDTVISDGGIRQLAAGPLPSLRILNIPQTNVTAKGIAELEKIPSLVQLRIGGASIDDAAAAAIARLPNLRSLHLIGPTLTGNGLRELAASERLSSLYIDDCPLPDEAWVALFDKKPGLHVHIDQHHHDRDPSKHVHP